MFLAGHPSQGYFGLQSHCAPCYFFNQASFYPSDFSFKARKLIVPQLSQTYAQAAKSSTLNNSTQTDENITKINCPPLKLLPPLSSKQRPNIPTAITTSSSAQTQLLPSISSKTSTILNPQPPTPMSLSLSLSDTKGKIKEQPSPVNRPRKDNNKN
ncbi:hypothetical protein TNCV_2543901 [Trichonephila clavipes]|nr:hypothetical protein TNCV_2543901 [Trichonephila clavipes]